MDAPRFVLCGGNSSPDFGDYNVFVAVGYQASGASGIIGIGDSGSLMTPVQFQFAIITLLQRFAESFIL
jgi:hypothetical protein